MHTHAFTRKHTEQGERQTDKKHPISQQTGNSLQPRQCQINNYTDAFYFYTSNYRTKNIKLGVVASAQLPVGIYPLDCNPENILISWFMSPTGKWDCVRLHNLLNILIISENIDSH